jgi:hypothetical protein
MTSNYIFSFCIIIVLLTSCSTHGNDSKIRKTESCLSSKEKRSEFSLGNKKFLSSRNRVLKIEVGDFSTLDPTILSKDMIKDACNIASAIITSRQFQNELEQLDFQYLNHCKSCLGGNISKPDRIPGSEVLDSLFRTPTVKLNFIIRKGKCNGALGSTCPDSKDITSNYKAIKCDMPDLPMKYAYAVHLCHEFAHTVGYCHTDHTDDVAEKIGWIAYYIAVDMHNNNPGL